MHKRQHNPLSVPSEVSVRTKSSSSAHSVVSLRMSLKAFTGCPRKPSGSPAAAAERTSSLSAHLEADVKSLTHQHLHGGVIELQPLSVDLRSVSESYCLIWASLFSSVLM